jgi:hypothetical protein
MRKIWLTIFLTVVAVSSGNAAARQQEVRKVAIVSVMTEAAIVSSILFEDRLGIEVGELAWSGSFSDREWKMEAKGNIANTQVTIFINGYLWGHAKENWTVGYSGQGAMDEESIYVNGRTEWHYDPSLEGHQNMDFQQIIKFGDNTFWGWVLGAETFVGGSIGAAGGIAAGPIGSLSGAIALSSAAVGLSAGAKFLLKSDEPVDPPRTPDRPKKPLEGDVIAPADNLIITAISSDDSISASAFGRLRLEGTWNSQEGNFLANVFQQ